MRLRFTKMQGAGNDFVVIDGVTHPFALTREQLRRLADRHFGVGADQILLVEPASRPEIDFSYRIFNADGGEVEQCGNGARCFVRFVRDRGLTSKRSIRVETLAGVLEPRDEGDRGVTVDMGSPTFELGRVPFDASGLEPRLAGDERLWPLEVNGKRQWLAVLAMGNPHAVQWVDNLEAAALAVDGPVIERHPRFPKRVNAGFAQWQSDTEIALRVYERGAGETLACGSGACAAVVTGIRQGRLHSPVTVVTRGGRLRIAWDGTGSVLMTGPAETVFEGEIDL